MEARHRSTRVCSDLERREADDIAVRYEECDDCGYFGNVTGEHGRIEHHGQSQSTRALDVFLSNGIEGDLARKASALLRQIDMEGDIDETSLGQLAKQITCCSNPVGHQCRAHSSLPNPPDDFDQLLPLSERGISSRDLHIRVGP